MPALVKAIEERRFKQARLLVESGYNINDKDKESGHTALIASCLLEDEQKACCITKWLLSHEACTLTCDNKGLTALMHACKNRNPRIVELLLKEIELDLKAQDNQGNSALLYSIKAGDLKMTKAILSEFVKRKVEGQDQANNLGETPLILAAKLGHLECCDVLLKEGKSSPHARDFKMKMTAEEWKKLVDSKNAQNSLNIRLLYRNKTGTSRSINMNSTNNSIPFMGRRTISTHNYPQRMCINGQVLQPVFDSNSGQYSGHSINLKKPETSRQLLGERRQRKKGLVEKDLKDGGNFSRDLTIERLKNTESQTSQVRFLYNKQNKVFYQRGHTSQSLRSDDAVDLTLPKPTKGRNDNRSMSAPQRAFVNHVSRHRHNYKDNYETTLEVKPSNDSYKPKREKSFIQDQLPRLFLTLGEQISPSYRVKATPPKPVEQFLCKETDHRRKYILKRFAKAGFASIVMTKLSGVRKKSGVERVGRHSPFCGSVRGRARSSSCRSDGSSQSSSQWI